MAYPETSNLGYVEPRDGDPADIQVINQYFTAKADEDIYLNRCMIAPFYSNESGVVYNTGDIVQYERVTYVCLEDNVSGNWDATKWEQTTLGKEIATNGEGGSAEVTKEASGNPIEITDGANAPLVKCVTAIQGNQDLHGYDKPWVGGAGKNKLPLTVDEVKAANTGGTWSGLDYVINNVTFSVIADNGGNVTGIKVNGTNSSTSYIQFIVNVSLQSGSYILNGCPNGGTDNTYFLQLRNTTPYVDVKDLGNGVAFTISESITGFARIVVMGGQSITNQMFYPMIRLSTVSDATFEPYSNICPITAYTEGEIEVRGKNLVNKDDFVVGSIDSSGNDSSSTTRLRSPFIFIDNTKNYSISCNTEVSIYEIDYYGVNKNWLGYTRINATEGQYTPSSETYYIKILVRYLNNDNISVSDLTKFQLEVGSTPTTYEPYLGTTHTATFSQSIYQGNADFVGGVAECVRKMIVIDENSGGEYAPLYNCYLLNTTEFEQTSASNLSQFLCNRLSAHINSGASSMNYEFLANGYGNILFRISGFSSTSDYNTWLASNPLQIVGLLKTPTTETITPTNLPMKSLFGYNHIESSTGDMEIEYITGEYQPLVDLIQSSKHVYSTAEQVVGTWIDGSTVYEKTYTVNIEVNNSNWTSTGIEVGDMDKAISVVAGNNVGTCWNALFCAVDQTYIRLICPRNGDTIAVNWFTLRYTKSTATRSLSRGGEELTKGKPIEEKETEEVNEK